MYIQNIHNRQTDGRTQTHADDQNLVGGGNKDGQYDANIHTLLIMPREYSSDENLQTHNYSATASKARFPLPELTARVNGPS